MTYFDKGIRGLLDPMLFAIPDHGAGIKDTLVQNAMRPRKPGLFGRESKLWDILGVLGDAATGQSGYGRTVMERQQQERQDRERLRERQEISLGLQEAVDPTDSMLPFLKRRRI